MLKSGRLPQGTGIGLYGYKWLKDDKKRIHIEHEAMVVKRMFEMVAEMVLEPLTDKAWLVPFLAKIYIGSFSRRLFLNSTHRVL